VNGRFVFRSRETFSTGKSESPRPLTPIVDRRVFSVPPEMEEASLCAGAKRGNRTAWTKVYEYHGTAESSSSRRAALRALACVEDVRALSRSGVRAPGADRLPPPA